MGSGSERAVFDVQLQSHYLFEEVVSALGRCARCNDKGKVEGLVRLHPAEGFLVPVPRAEPASRLLNACSSP